MRGDRFLLFLSILAVTLFGGGATVSLADQDVLIGGTISLEGTYVEPSLMGQEAYRYWAREINDRGGLLGRKVRLILYDDKSDPELARSLYRRLIEEDQVDLVLSPYSSPLTLVASELCEKNRKLLLSIAAAAEEPWQRGARYLFQLYAPAKRQFVGLLDLMARKEYRKLAIIYNDSSSFNTDIAEGIRVWGRKFGLEIVYDRGYRDGERELPAILKEIRAAGVDGLINSSYPPNAYVLLRLLQEMGYRPAVLAMPIVSVHPDFLEKVGGIGEGVFGPSQWEPDERIPFPGTEQFIAGFERFTGHKPSFHAASAYSGCQLLERAVTETGTLDNSRLRDYIASLDTVTVLGRVKVDPRGLQMGHSTFIIQWQNGRKEIVWPRKMQTAEPQF